MLKSARFFIYSLLSNTRFANFLALLIVLNVICMILETVPQFSEYRPWFVLFEFWSIIFFCIEYLLRLWTAPLMVGFKGYWNAIWNSVLLFDAVILLPFLLANVFPMIISFEMLMIFRIFRLLRLPKYFDSVYRIIEIIYRHRQDLSSAFLLTLFIVLLGSTAMYHAEHAAQPEKFASIVHSFYWGVITFATIGYGDVVPVTNIGKVLTSFIALFGVMIYTLPTGIIVSAFYQEIRSKQAKEMEKMRNHIRLLEAENLAYRKMEHHERTSLLFKNHPNL